jgi:phospho-N-acetylmuramoyl-pentapeptide-transferase
MKNKQFGQAVREEGPESHYVKQGTPTMGGLFILGSAFLTIGICGNFFSMPLLVTLFVTASHLLLGFTDDYLNIKDKSSAGLRARTKLIWQFLIGAFAGYLLIHFKVITTEIYLPFLKEPLFDAGYFYIFFTSLVVVASSNAVNLTDGLDGLAVGPVITSAATLGLLCYVGGHFEMSDYLYIPFIKNLGEISVFVAAIIGACTGFLWYNSYPAEVFMGDVGSLSLGSALGIMAVISKNEFLFFLFGGIFVLEAVSVIIQVGSFKLRKKRVFRMAPIHHHFELKGWKEPKVIVRFWIISLILAILSLASLKLR